MLGQFAPEITLSLYWLTFVEGLLAFLSPCILPLLPIYLMYLCGNEDFSQERRRLLINTLGFVAGFTIVFVLLGATASGLGSLVSQNRDLLQRFGGLVMIALGLNYLGVLNLPILNRSGNMGVKPKNLHFFSSMVFGAAFSLGWTPCLGAFLGSALLLASNAATLYHGSALLFTFSMGLGIPFVLTAFLWDRLKGALTFIKKNFSLIKAISGGLLILVGLSMVFGVFGYYLGLFV